MNTDYIPCNVLYTVYIQLNKTDTIFTLVKLSLSIEKQMKQERGIRNARAGIVIFKDSGRKGLTEKVTSEH